MVNLVDFPRNSALLGVGNIMSPDISLGIEVQKKYILVLEVTNLKIQKPAWF